MTRAALALLLAACVAEPERAELPPQGIYSVSWLYRSGPPQLAPAVTDDSLLLVDQRSALFFAPPCGPSCDLAFRVDGDGRWVFRGSGGSFVVELAGDRGCELRSDARWPGGVEWEMSAHLFEAVP